MTQTELYEVFMLDGDFSIERPRRVYRRSFLHLPGSKVRDRWTHNDPVANITDADADEDDEAENGNGEAPDPLEAEMIVQAGEGQGRDGQKMHDDEESRASQHTFYVVNSQRRLKLVARNAVSCAPGCSIQRRASADPTASNAPVHRLHGAHCGAISVDRP